MSTFIYKSANPLVILLQRQTCTNFALRYYWPPFWFLFLLVKVDTHRFFTYGFPLGNSFRLQNDFSCIKRPIYKCRGIHSMLFYMEEHGFEPWTFCVQSRRSTN